MKKEPRLGIKVLDDQENYHFERLLNHIHGNGYSAGYYNIMMHWLFRSIILKYLSFQLQKVLMNSLYENLENTLFLLVIRATIFKQKNKLLIIHTFKKTSPPTVLLTNN